MLLAIPILLAVAAGAIFFLRGRGGDDPGKEEEKDDTVDPPQVYTLGDTEILALPVFSEEVVVHAPEPPEAAEGEDPVTAVIYIYEGFIDSRELLAGYAGFLSTADMGFVYVDDGLMKTEDPDFEAESGSAILAKAGTAEDTVLSLRLEWTPESGTVVADTLEGRIQTPRPETLTLVEAEDYLRSLPPAALDLAGDSMAEYQIYPLAGSVLVDGKVCLHVSVYSLDENTGANEIAGEYFIAADKSHIYKRDMLSGTVREVSGVS